MKRHGWIPGFGSWYSAWCFAKDVIAILLMAALITIANAGAVSIRALSIAASLLALFIVVLIAIGLVTVPYIVREVARGSSGRKRC